MKQIQVSEAARRLGVNRQTLENWGKLGVLNIRKSGRTFKAHWVDADTIDALSDTIADVERAHVALTREKAEVEKSYRAIHEKTMELRRELFFLNRFGSMFFAKDFYLSIPTMLERIGILNEREARIMRFVIDGQDLDYVADDFGLTRERVRQIFFRACRKARRLDGIRDCLEENEHLKSENAELKSCMQIMIKDLKVQQAADKALCDKGIDGYVQHVKETGEIWKLLNTRIRECDLSVRALNCLACADIKTIGELCRWQKNDLMKFRNFGKRSLAELDDFLESLGLRFGMDVDKIYRDCVVRRLSKDDNNEQKQDGR